MDTSRMIPADRIQNREVAEYAAEAAQFLASHHWCRSVVSTHLAWAVAGVLGVFLCRLVPARAEVDDTLWVVVGDLPPAYLVCDDASDWREALDAYIYEMEQWVVAVRSGSSLDDVIPVKVDPTVEHADMLDSRLAFIRTRIIADDAEDIESDT
jgi:hypothetical protein